MLWPTTVVGVGYGITLDLPALIGMAVILAGVLVINLFSQSSAHYSWSGRRSRRRR